MLQVDGQVLINGGDGNNKAIIRARNGATINFGSDLSLVGNYAVVGLSMPRREGSFTGLALDDHLAQRNAKACCGLQVIDLDSGDIVHWLRIDGSIQELYDVAVLPGVRQPKALGFLTNEIQHHVSLPNN
ncbi:MAG: DUF4915 domain-containing protein [Pirellulaceae bacterium]|jgi:uncharacterized protein (TIGR03032 family)|nr:DUF4915 domain-containing protein [Pirellulaceae bacterium]